MTLTATQQKVNDAYEKLFGRPASFGTLGGADYWVDQINNQSLSDSELDRILGASDEGVKYAADQVASPGGIDPSKSMAANAAAGNTWAKHFAPGGSLSAGTDLTGTIWEGLGAGASGNQGTDDAASALNNIAAATNTPVNNLGGAYYNQGINAQGFTSEGDPINNDQIVTNTGDGSNQVDTSQFLTTEGLQSWWDALDKSSFTGNQSGGMDDFMKFMMLMSVMKGGGGMGGYGGSQYGYGGLNPGGVMQAYDPLAQLQGMGTWFKDNFGSGGATTSTVNTGTT